ncbi:hypothetical protein GS471_17075 [Rhodococcus hoagii]|nr:hypothetical protein [Prescottella equi]
MSCMDETAARRLQAAEDHLACDRESQTPINLDALHACTNAARLAVYRAKAELYRAKARELDARMKAEQADRDLKIRRSLKAT